MPTPFLKYLVTVSVNLLTVIAISAANATSLGGEVLLAKGTVTATDSAGESRILAKKDKVSQEDTITTAVKSFIVIRMEDRTKITLKPGTTMQLGEFNLDVGREKAELNLLRGGFRTVTGLIGEKSPDKFQVNTLVATIGIRGTDFLGELCGTQSDCLDREETLRKATSQSEYIEVEDSTLEDEINNVLPLGLYVLVKDGEIYIDNCTVSPSEECSTVDVGVGQVGYASAQLDLVGRTKSVPLILDQEPSFRFSDFTDEQLDAVDVLFENNPDGVICEVQ